MKAAESAPSPNNLLNRLGIVKAKKKISLIPEVSMVAMAIRRARPSMRLVMVPRLTTAALLVIFSSSVIFSHYRSYYPTFLLITSYTT
jgi:hypothetical protein